MKSFFLILIAISVPGISVFAQERSWQVGIKAMIERTRYFDDGLGYGAGLQVIYKSKQQFGVETGIQWQYRRAMRLYVTVDPANPGDEIADYNTNRLQIPVLFRYNSKILNGTLGPVIDIELNTKLKTKSTDPALKILRPYTTRAGISAGMSHTFNLRNKWVFEPALRAYYVNIDREDNGGFSFDIVFRRRIF